MKTRGLKSWIVFTVVCVPFLLGLGSSVWAQESKDLYPQHLFFPPEGYDNNDEITVIVDGLVGHGCVEVEPASFTQTDHGVIAISITSKTKELKECQNLLQLPENLKHPHSFTQEVSLGTLAAGTYELVLKGFDQDLKPQTYKLPLKVKPSQISSIDDGLYAELTNIFISEFITETENGELIVTGALGSTCLDFDTAQTKVLRYNQGDHHMIVLLPYLSIQENDGGENQCEYVPRGIFSVINLGKLTPGRYNIHVRVGMGKALNRVFTVIPKETSPDSHF